MLKHVVPEEMLDVNKRLAKGRRLSGNVNGIRMDRRKSSSSQMTNQILYWLVGMKDISTLNPLLLNKPPTNSARVDAQIGLIVFHLPLIFPSTSATLLINSISSLAFCNFGKAWYWEKSLNIGKPLFTREPQKKTTSDDWLKEQEIQHPILSLESECFNFFGCFDVIINMKESETQENAWDFGDPK